MALTIVRQAFKLLGGITAIESKVRCEVIRDFGDAQSPEFPRFSIAPNCPGQLGQCPSCE
jgi:hypothetical protein